MGAEPSRPRFARCPLRPFLHHNPDIAGAVLRIFLRAIRTTLCRASPGAPRDGKLGGISFLHRFGSSLNTHFHYHCVILDGVFSHGPDGEVRFHAATRLASHRWLELQGVVQRRVLRYFRRGTHQRWVGLLDEADTSNCPIYRHPFPPLAARPKETSSSTRRPPSIQPGENRSRPTLRVGALVFDQSLPDDFDA